MKLSEILAGLTGVATVHPWPDLEILGISHHSDTVQTGDIFVAIQGFKWDGHSFAAQAVNCGAVAVVAQKPLDLPVPVIIVPDSRIALAELSHIIFKFPSRNLKMVGITASNGKTTTAFMTEHLLSAKHKTGLIGTVIVNDGNSVVSADLTTPQSKDLIELLAKIRSNGCSHLVMEVSSAGLELKRVHGIRFNIAAFNNISREHIDFHGSFENYWHWKSSLIRELASASTAILNADDAMIYGLRNHTLANVISYSLKGNDAADFILTDVEMSGHTPSYVLRLDRVIEGPDFTLEPMDLPLKLGVLGLHNVYNSAVAVIIALLCGVAHEEIQARIPNFGGVERRFQLLYRDRFTVLDDHFANTGNIDITLETLGLMTYNNLHLLVAIRGNRGVIVNTENADAICKWAKKLNLSEIYVTDSIEYTGEKDKVTELERSSFIDTLEQGNIRVHYYPKLSTAADAVLERLTENDTLLLAGCQGMDSGAHVVLPKIAKIVGSPEDTSILAPLRNRVAGNVLT